MARFPSLRWVLLAAVAGSSLAAGPRPAQRTALPKPPRAYRVQVLYDLYNPEHARYEAPTRYDTLFCPDSVEYHRWVMFYRPYTPYLVHQTTTIRLPMLRRGGYDVKLSQQLDRMLRQQYFTGYKRIGSASVAPAVRQRLGPPTSANTRAWAWTDVTGATLLITPSQDSLVGIGVEQAEGGAERESRAETYVFQLRAGRVREVTEPLKKQLYATYYPWLRRQAARAGEYPVLRPERVVAIGIEWLDFAPRGLQVGCVFCTPMPDSRTDIDCSHSDAVIIPYPQLTPLFGRALAPARPRR